MAYEELFSELIRREDEEDITELLNGFGLKEYNDINWLPFGGVQNNYGQIGTQQADSISALIETLVNAVDAVLQGECLKRNLDPSSSVAPRTMVEAAEQFLSVPDGNLAKISTTERTKLAERYISVMITG